MRKNNECKVIAFANAKGGVSKSTSCQNIGVVLHQDGYNVLCVDIDPQAHLSVAFGITEPEYLKHSLTHLFDHFIKYKETNIDEVRGSIIKTSTIDLLPTTYDMDLVDIQLNSITDREYALTDILSCIKDEYDYILLDCNSSRNIFTTNAFAFADEVIIPNQTQYLSTIGIQLIMSAIKTIKRRINPNLKVTGILCTLYNGTKQSKDSVSVTREKYGDMVFETVIPMRTAVGEGQSKGKSIVEYQKGNPVSEAYRKVVREMMSHE